MRLHVVVLRPVSALLLQPMRPKWRGTTSADSIAGSYMTSVRPSGVKPLKPNVPLLGSCGSQLTNCWATDVCLLVQQSVSTVSTSFSLIKLTWSGPVPLVQQNRRTQPFVLVHPWLHSPLCQSLML